MSSYGAYRMMHALHESRRPRTLVQAPEPAAPTYAPAAQPGSVMAQPGSVMTQPSAPQPSAPEPGPLMAPEPPPPPKYTFLKGVLKRHNQIVQGGGQ